MEKWESEFHSQRLRRGNIEDRPDVKVEGKKHTLLNEKNSPLTRLSPSL